MLRLSGVTYGTTATLTVGVIDLIPCTTPGVGPAPPPVDVVDSMISHTVASGRGDQMVLPARAAPQGTRVSLERQAGAYRSVRAYASAPVKNARISIDITDCTLPTGKRLTVVREVSPDVWEDVGGSVAGGKITTPPLPHLSIYALAGGN
ncbi:MAG TPA: hypothetical protein VFJ16_06355 [Longimicrobium sp.]|nr:hypothetical protein [Longimicrobium sp.]